jgi:hypothetical protein
MNPTLDNLQWTVQTHTFIMLGCTFLLMSSITATANSDNLWSRIAFS